MKYKIFLVLIAALALNVNAFSQIKLGIGVEAGMNIANVSVSPDVSTSTRSGLIIGGNVDIGISKTFSIQPGIRFIMKGFVQTYTDAGGNQITQTDKLNYLEIPVLLKVSFPLTEVKPYLMAGPTLGFQMAASGEAVGGGQTQTGDISSSFSSSDFGLLFGGGVEFKVAQKISLYGNFGYQLGLSNILKDNTNSTVKNNGIQFVAGAMFHL